MKRENFRKGVLDYILVFIVLFVAFVWMLTLGISYSNTGRVQNSLDLMSAQGSRILSTSGNMNALITLANDVRIKMMKEITSADISGSCVADGGQIVTLQTTFYFDPPMLEGKTITSSASAYNEINTTSCIYTLNVKAK